MNTNYRSRAWGEGKRTMTTAGEGEGLKEGSEPINNYARRFLKEY